LLFLEDEDWRLEVPTIFADQGGSALQTSDLINDRFTYAAEIEKIHLPYENLPQSSLARFHAGLFNNSGAYSVFHQRSLRTQFFSKDSTLDYFYFQDYGAMLSQSGKILESDKHSIGLGITLSAIYRKGQMTSVNSKTAGSETSYLIADQKKPALGVGLSYSFLYSHESFQGGFVFRNLGGMPFVDTGILTGENAFSGYANNPTAGVGYLLPKYHQRVRHAIRVEYSQWGRRIPITEKAIVNYETRFPFLASLTTSVAASGRWSLGVGLRFLGVEVDLGSYSEVLGEGASAYGLRHYALEARGIF
jgi:hypothetical protein